MFSTRPGVRTSERPEVGRGGVGKYLVLPLNFTSTYINKEMKGFYERMNFLQSNGGGIDVDNVNASADPDVNVNVNINFQINIWSKST